MSDYLPPISTADLIELEALTPAHFHHTTAQVKASYAVRDAIAVKVSSYFSHLPEEAQSAMTDRISRAAARALTEEIEQYNQTLERGT